MDKEAHKQSTVVPIENIQVNDQLEKFVQTRGLLKNKSSLCRFFLRGICIMKSEYCKFAHSVEELSFGDTEKLYYCSNKEEKRKEANEKKEFNQTALFILKEHKYYALYNYQFGERYKQTNMPIVDLETLSSDRGKRIRIREILHKEIWDGFILFLERRFPNTNFPVSFVSFWYANFGFDKPQTRCKFGDFLKYSMHYHGYIQVDILFPPSLIPTIYFINSKSKETLLEKNVSEIYKNYWEEKEKEGKQKMEQFLESTVPENMSKKYICRYFMAGNCQLEEEECVYAHTISKLKEKYEPGQDFPVECRQPVMPIETRLSFISLFNATRKFEEFQQYSLEDINFNSTIRNQLREKIHFELFADFMKLIEEKSFWDEKNEQYFRMDVKELQRYYNGAGFNHTNENKFQHLESALWRLGYYMEEEIVKSESVTEKKKVTIVHKIPPLQYLNKIYSEFVKECVQTEISNLPNEGILLESSLKRALYSSQKPNMLPLHVYLRCRKTNFQDVINEYCDKEDCSKIFFESMSENMKNFADIVRKYMKKNKSYILKIDEIESYIKNEKKYEMNLNHHFTNLRNAIQTILIEMGKKVYFWPFDNNAFVIDLSLHKKIQMLQQNLADQEESYSSFKEKILKSEETEFCHQRIIIVDSNETFNYAEKYLEKCVRLGVDLEGKLRKDGFIDLIQISAVKRSTENQAIEHKHIFIFDILLMKKQSDCKSENQTKSSNLLEKTTNFLKILFEDEKKLKILHDCRHDSIALKYLLGICLKNVFDTSGFDIYINQKSIYEKESLKGLNLLKKIYDVKISGLNAILLAYKAPNGINIHKESMKNRFGEAGSRPYFEARPINEEFIEYSAKDVEDLIEVYENMRVEDTEHISEFIGELYSSC